MKYRFFTVTVPIILLVVGAFYFTAQFIQPSPKKEITIATGSKTGNYYKTALEYKRLLEQDKVKVNIITSAGSIENIKLLQENKADIAFLQNGTITNEEAKGAKSLASIYYEPLWVFYKNDGYPVDYIIQLISKKISIGKVGSGTRDLAQDILKDNGITTENSTILEYSTSEAKEALLKNEIDAMFVVSSHKSQTVKELLANPNINVLSFKRARAYSRKYTFLEALTLYEGTLDLYRNLPDENINLLATTANLAVRDDFSEELTRLVLKKVVEVHNKKGLFAKADQFPNSFNMKLDLSEEAQRYFEYGDTFLEKIFPYWIASNIDRLKILLIPLLTLLFPLFKGVFPLYNWSMRSKIYRWYDEIREIDNQLEETEKINLKEELEKLEKLRCEISKETKVPLSFMGEYYNLQLHIDHVKKRVEKLL
ncbi:TAXI family TRAP transporter solute-binding subunit [Arcobacter sp. LA11]|uniref:TAXI family TRAP transporter solute-binding subunit n=1 Tax=Arcobacter sp. LA11 TaxID=1898176 RepID=UPI000932712F|nr:TAXI family TRAP transporter solute-binding subunit [Arcobacter sp. LA11]